MDWLGLISLIFSTVFAGGLLGFITLKEKKQQEQERTKQSSIETEKQNFDYLAERVRFAEEHIVTLHKKMTGMQNVINELMGRVVFAEDNICLRDDCPIGRIPKRGTYRHNKKQNETNQ